MHSLVLSNGLNFNCLPGKAHRPLELRTCRTRPDYYCGTEIHAVGVNMAHMICGLMRGAVSTLFERGRLH